MLGEGTALIYRYQRRFCLIGSLFNNIYILRYSDILNVGRHDGIVPYIIAEIVLYKVLHAVPRTLAGLAGNNDTLVGHCDNEAVVLQLGTVDGNFTALFLITVTAYDYLLFSRGHILVRQRYTCAAAHVGHCILKRYRSLIILSRTVLCRGQGG